MSTQERDSSWRKPGRFGCLLRVLAIVVALILLVVVILLFAANYDQYSGQPPPTGARVIRGGTLFDGNGGAPQDNALIVIQGERIACVGADCRVPDGAGGAGAPRVIDATGLAILPGLIDLHVHFATSLGADVNQSFLESGWDLYVRKRPQVRRAFHAAGVTAIRSVGDMKDNILSIKKQVASGELAGPRIFTVGPMFTAPGGHPAGTLYRGNSFKIENGTREVSDPEAARAAVRQLASEGVDGIKVVYDGDQVPRLGLRVMEAIIEEAHKRNLWVAVHVGTVQEIRDAVLAGVDSVEHIDKFGTLMDADLIALMKARNVTWSPNLAVNDMFAAGEGSDMGISDPEVQAIYREIGKRLKPVFRTVVMPNVKAAADAGVRIGAGTDALGNMSFGESLHRELELLVQAGLSPTQALLAATRNAAIALRAEQDLGTIAPGKYADLLLVSGKPWERISDIRNIRVVMQGGRVVVDKK